MPQRVQKLVYRAGKPHWVPVTKNATQLRPQWPMTSEGAGVHPSQIAEAEAGSIARGVPVKFTKQGDAIFKSKEHRRKALKMFGMYDEDGYD